MNKYQEIVEYLKVKYPEDWEEYFRESFESPSLKRIILKNIAAGKVGDKKALFITIQNWKLHSIEDQQRLEQFCKRIEYLFEHIKWCVESGKSDPPNYHLHLLCKSLRSKTMKRDMGVIWYKIFGYEMHPRGTDFYHCKQHRDAKGMPKYQDWVREKEEYFEEQLKGSHSNTNPSIVGGTS